MADAEDESPLTVEETEAAKKARPKIAKAAPEPEQPPVRGHREGGYEYDAETGYRRAL